MIKSAALWHVTPVHIGTEFFDPVTSVLEANEALYTLVNSDTALSKTAYSKTDYASIVRMRTFIQKIKRYPERSGEASVTFFPDFPGIRGCILKVQLTARMFCYIMFNGTAVFLDYGEEIPFDNEQYISLPCFLERQTYEDDYCVNPECSDRKRPLYEFLNYMWECMDGQNKYFSSSKAFRNNGVSYTLCITILNIPDLVSNKPEAALAKNINAMLDTSPFNNIYDTHQWQHIRERVDEYATENPRIKELSENLIFADNWSGVVLAGNIEQNIKSITWFMEFEILLQSNWLLFDAYLENILRQDLSLLELQEILSRAEFLKSDLDNDISSNMEQSRHVMRNALIDSSDINVIYSRLHGMLSHKIKLQNMHSEKKKARYSLLADIALVVIAGMEIYGSVVDFLKTRNFGIEEFGALGLIGVLAAVCIWSMMKGRN